MRAWCERDAARWPTDAPANAADMRAKCEPDASNSHSPRGFAHDFARLQGYNPNKYKNTDGSEVTSPKGYDRGQGADMHRLAQYSLLIHSHISLG